MSIPNSDIVTKNIKNMENRVLSLKIRNKYSLYILGSTLTSRTSISGHFWVFEGVWGFEDVKNALKISISSTHTWHINMLMCWHETSWTKNFHRFFYLFNHYSHRKKILNLIFHPLDTQFGSVDDTPLTNRKTPKSWRKISVLGSSHVRLGQ